MNAAQRSVIQRRQPVRQSSTDANGFAAALRDFGIRTQAETQQLLEATAAAVHESIVHGSQITNAPGQPVDAGDLRDSWRIRRVAPTAMEVYTTSPYARAIEHNYRRVSRRQFKEAAKKMGLKLTRRGKALLRKRFGGMRFRRGGSHSVSLTARAFTRLVAAVVAELFPGTTRNIAGGVRASGIKINVGSRSGTA